MKSKFKVNYLHKKYVRGPTTPGNEKPGKEVLVYYNLMENQVTILTVYCVKEIENNYF